MDPAKIRLWSQVHTWTSLVCTAFLVMLCLTGLPLIFHDEIEGALNPDTWHPAHPAGELLSLDQVLAVALAGRPGEVPLFMSFDTDRPVVNVTTAPTPDAPGRAMHFVSLDRTSGDVVPQKDRGSGVMQFLLDLHTDLFLGLPGMLFLGAMGLVFAASVVSGVVVYGPFMRKLPFGTLRRTQSRPVRWLDWHNLLGIVTVAWVLVVGLTGVINTLEQPIVATWRRTQLADLVAPYRGQPRPRQLASLDAAVSAAQARAPGMELQFVAFPGSAYSSNHHYAVFFHGATPLTSRLVTPALVDASSGRFVALRGMPWYATLLSVSRPLHFGDYGGLPLKVLWAAFTVLTLVVLGGGLYLWIARRRGGVLRDGKGDLPVADAAG